MRKQEILATAATKGLRVYAKVTVGCGEWHTGVEMEALTATNAALLTLYDMCKGIEGAVDGGMRIGRVQLIEKIGGKSGHWTALGARKSNNIEDIRREQQEKMNKYNNNRRTNNNIEEEVDEIHDEMTMMSKNENENGRSQEGGAEPNGF